MSEERALDDPPQCVRVVRSSNTALRLAWDPCHSCSTPEHGYEIELTSQQSESLVHPVGQDTWTEVYGLVPGVVYSARARAVCKARFH